MKPAIGLILAVLSFAVIAQADRVSCSGEALVGRAGKVLTPQAAPTEAPAIAILLDEPGTIDRDPSTNFDGLGSPMRLTDDVLGSRFDDPATLDRGSAQFYFIQLWLDGFLGRQDDGRGGRFGIEHPEPVRRFVGIQDVPEPGTVLMMSVGLALIAVSKRRASNSGREKLGGHRA
jgi:hypothetical protein